MATPVDKKLLRQTKFPPEFNQKVDMTKVNIEVMKKWISGRISEILGNEDDVVIELCFNLLEGNRYPDIKALQIQLTGFLDKDTSKFCKELWSLCLSGQKNPQGVPKELLEAKKLELIQEKIEAERVAEAARRQREREQAHERELEDLRRRERADRSRGRRGGSSGGRGSRGGRDYDRRSSRSPPPRYRSRDRFREPPSRREFDSYVPSSSHRAHRLSRSPRSRSRSRSRSPSRSSSRSPPRRYRDERCDSSRGGRRTYSRSPTPDRRGHRGGRQSPEYSDGDSDRHPRRYAARSPTPRRTPSRARSVSRSVSRPSRRHRRRRAYSSESMSRSRSRSRGRRGNFRRVHREGYISRSRGRSRSRNVSGQPRNAESLRRSLERCNTLERRLSRSCRSASRPSTSDGRAWRRSPSAGGVPGARE